MGKQHYKGIETRKETKKGPMYTGGKRKTRKADEIDRVVGSFVVYHTSRRDKEDGRTVALLVPIDVNHNCLDV